MEPESSLPHSHLPANCPCPQPARSSPYSTYHFLKIHPNIIPPSMPGFFKLSPSLRPAHENPVYAPPLPLKFIFPNCLIRYFGFFLFLASWTFENFHTKQFGWCCLWLNVHSNHQSLIRLWSNTKVLVCRCSLWIASWIDIYVYQE